MGGGTPERENQTSADKHGGGFSPARRSCDWAGKPDSSRSGSGSQTGAMRQKSGVALCAPAFHRPGVEFPQERAGLGGGGGASRALQMLPPSRPYPKDQRLMKERRLVFRDAPRRSRRSAEARFSGAAVKISFRLNQFCKLFHHPAANLISKA